MHLFPVTSNFANLASRLLCHIAGLGLETHIFAPEKCVDIEIGMTLFKRFKCSFDEYQHPLNTNDKELNEAFDTICQGHQDVLKLSLFSESVLEQLADKTLVPIDFDDYLHVFDDNEVEGEVVEEYKKISNYKVPSTTDIISTDNNSLTPSNRHQSSRGSPSSQLLSFSPALSRRSSVSLTSSHATNLCHLSDKDFRSYVTTIQDVFLSRASPELAL
ncbi:unnamed protein product [Adineta steineri]|uniref:Uncharacterized protein n=1 Tax=Adineta steineri TaxID=433720 RepID=A0A819MLH5_9BILA|nr:unnamed protein product [Adineta steineri]